MRGIIVNGGRAGRRALVQEGRAMDGGAKGEVRRAVRAELERMGAAQMAQESARCCAAVLRAEFFVGADVVLCYMPMAREVDVLPVVRSARALGKAVALPRVVPGTRLMDFFLLDGGLPLEAQLAAGTWGVREPLASLARLEPAALAGASVCAVVPGVAFTPGGMRLGRGGGYYDRYLPRLPAAAGSLTLAGVCFSCQLLPALPAGPHDVRMDAVLHG